MSLDKLNPANVAQALNNADVRGALAKKGIHLTEKSIFKVSDTGIQIDIEGDGVFDITVDGLFKKDGSINTNHKKYDIDATDVNTIYIRKQNSLLEGLRTEIASYDGMIADLQRRKQVDEEFKPNEALMRTRIEKEKADIGVSLNTAKTDLANAKKDYDKHHNDWTTEQCEDYQKRVAALEEKVKKLQAQYDNFDVELHLKAEKELIEKGRLLKIAQYEQQIAEVNEKRAKTEKKLHKAIHAYNDYLNKHGYETTESRNAVKDLKYDANAATEAGTQLKKAETTEETAVRLATEKFKKAYPDVKDFSVKYDAKNGFITISLKDGDTIGDFAVVGFLDPEKKTLNFDDSKLEMFESSTSTRNLAKANADLRALEKAADGVDYAMDTGKAKSEYAKIDAYKEKMGEAGITMDWIKAYRAQHPDK